MPINRLSFPSIFILLFLVTAVTVFVHSIVQAIGSGSSSNPYQLRTTWQQHDFNSVYDESYVGTHFFYADMVSGGGTCSLQIEGTNGSEMSVHVTQFEGSMFGNYQDEYSGSNIDAGTSVILNQIINFNDNTQQHFMVEKTNEGPTDTTYQIRIAGDCTIYSSPDPNFYTNNMTEGIYGGGVGDDTYPTEPRNLPFTAVDDANSVLVLFISYNDGAPWVSAGTEFTGVTYNDIPMYRGCQGAQGDAGAEIWYLPNPPAGTHDIFVTSTWPQQPAQAVYHAIQVGGIDVSSLDSQTYVDNNSYCTGGNGTDITLDMTNVSAGDLILSLVTDFSGTTVQSNDPTPGNVTALFENIMEWPNWIKSSGYHQIAAGADTLYWNFVSAGSGEYAATAVNFPLSESGGSSATPTPTPTPDTTPPSITFTSTHSSSYITEDITITGDVEDAESNIASVTITGTSDGSAISPVSATAEDGAFDELSESFTASITGLSGEVTLNAVVEDVEGNSYQQNYITNKVVDTIAPTLETNNLGSTPTSDNTPSYNITASDADSGVASLEVSFYAVSPGQTSDWESASIASGSAGDAQVDFSFTQTAPLDDGVKNTVMRVTDMAGNQAEYTVDRITIDAVDEGVPQVQLYDMVPNPTTDNTPIIQGKVKDDPNQKTSNIANIWYNLDGSGWQSTVPLDGSFDSHTEFFSIQLPELEDGQHTILIRARDTEGNQTNDTDDSLSTTFTVETPSETYNSTQLFKSEEFVTHEDHDLIAGESYIWGNGQLRLAEVLSPQMTQLDGNNYGPRYTSDIVQHQIEPSQAGGFWVTKQDRSLSYFDEDLNETNWSTAELGVEVHDVKEVVIDGDYTLWIATYYGILGLDIGDDINNFPQRIGTIATYNPLGVTGANTWAVDTRNGNLGFYLGTNNGNLRYYQPNNYGDSNDDVSVTFNIVQGVMADDVVQVFLDEATNKVWVSSYGEGVTVLDDNGTPTNQDDDQATVYDSQQYHGIFAIGKEKGGLIYLGGNGGLYVVTDDKGTFTAADDDVVTQITNEDLGFNTIYEVVYHPGEDPVKGQFFLSNETGDLKYLNVNDTYNDLQDDQLISFNVVNDLYPAHVTDMYMLDYNTLRAAVNRHGVYDINLNRDFAQSGYAETLTDARIEGRLDVDFITLSDVELIIEAGTVTYQVSNDGGLHWYDIAIGETVNFPTNDYRIKFRINMEHGSTPVVGGYDLTYFAYEDPENRGLNLGFSSVPNQVEPGQNFSFKVTAVDDLSNPVEGDVTVGLELRKVADNTVVEGFSPDSVTISDGTVTISNASANVEGDYRLYVYNQEDAAFSTPISFASSSNDSGDSDSSNTDTDDSSDDDSDDSSSSSPGWLEPELSISANKSELNSPQDVTLSWSGENINRVEIWSNYQHHGSWDTSGAFTTYVSRDTTFVALGEGPYGSVVAAVEIDVANYSGDTSADNDSSSEENETADSEEGIIDPDAEPVIDQFEVIVDDEDPTLVTVTWDVKNVDQVEISPLGKVNNKGSRQLHIHQDTLFKLVAGNQNGNAEQEKFIDVDEQAVAARQQELEKINKELQAGNKLWSWLRVIGWKFPLIIVVLIVLFAGGMSAYHQLRRKKQKGSSSKLNNKSRLK